MNGEVQRKRERERLWSIQLFDERDFYNRGWISKMSGVEIEEVRSKDLELLEDLSGVLGSRSVSSEITSDFLSFSDSRESSLLDLGSVIEEVHVTKHHDTGEKESGRVGLSLSSDIRSGTVNSFEDGSVLSDVSRGSESETSDQTSTHVGKNITVEVRHNHDSVSVRSRVLNDPQTDTVEEVLVVLDVGVFGSDLSARSEEHSVGKFHDGSLVDSGNVKTLVGASVFESVTSYSGRSFVGDEFDRLNDTVDNLVFDTGVLSLGVLTDDDRVDVIVRSLESFYGSARTNVGVKRESTTKGKVERNVTLSDRSGKGTLEGDSVLPDRSNGVGGNCRNSVNDGRGDIDFFPDDRDLGSSEDLLDRLGDLGSDTVSGNEGYVESSISVSVALERRNSSLLGNSRVLASREGERTGGSSEGLTSEHGWLMQVLKGETVGSD